MSLRKMNFASEKSTYVLNTLMMQKLINLELPQLSKNKVTMLNDSKDSKNPFFQ